LTNVLDKVIAVEFSKFDQANLPGGPAAMRYRRTRTNPDLDGAALLRV